MNHGRNICWRSPLNFGPSISAQSGATWLESRESLDMKCMLQAPVFMQSFIVVFILPYSETHCPMAKVNCLGEGHTNLGIRIQVAVMKHSSGLPYETSISSYRGVQSDSEVP